MRKKKIKKLKIKKRILKPGELLLNATLNKSLSPWK